jgi:hypothetical protein
VSLRFRAPLFSKYPEAVTKDLAKRGFTTAPLVALDIAIRGFRSVASMVEHPDALKIGRIRQVFKVVVRH